MKMKYKLSRKAKFDLIDIWNFTCENWSIEQANKYYQLIIDKIVDVSDNPRIGKNYHSVRKAYWGFQVKSHIIFYRISANDRIEIIRVLHQKMDFQNII